MTALGLEDTSEQRDAWRHCYDLSKERGVWLLPPRPAAALSPLPSAASAAKPCRGETQPGRGFA
jgi:hypothetical protein